MSVVCELKDTVSTSEVMGWQLNDASRVPVVSPHVRLVQDHKKECMKWKCVAFNENILNGVEGH